MKNPIKLFVLVAAMASFAFTNPGKGEPQKITVVIDAGHGGKDSGAMHDLYSEKDIVEKITKKIKSLNKNENVVIHLTRTGDDFIGLNERTDIINKIKPDLVLSLHINSSKNANSSGMNFYIPEENTSAEAEQFAQQLGISFGKNDFKVGRTEKAPFFILKHSEAPAIVVDLGYLSNQDDRNYLTDEQQQDKIAASILEFLGGIK